MAHETGRRSQRFLRFARGLALITGAAAGVSGCYASHETIARADGGVRTDAPARPDAPAPPDARARPDAPPDAPFLVADTIPTCGDCNCYDGWDAGSTPSCEAIGIPWCCYPVGPLSPPDLAA